MDYCPDCGAEVSGAESFCNACGTSLEATGRQDEWDNYVDDSYQRGGNPDDEYHHETGGHEQAGGSWGHGGGRGDERDYDRGDEQYGHGSAGYEHDERGWETEDYGSGRRGEGRREPGYERPDPETGALTFAIGYPKAGGFKPVLIGAVVYLFFWLIVPIFLAIGYFVRVAASAAAGRPEPPEFDDFGGLLEDGFVLFVAMLPIIIGFVIVDTIIGEISGLLGLLSSLAFAFLAPALVLNYAIERHWKAVYDFSRHVELWKESDYQVGFLLYFFVIYLLGGIVVFILLLLSILTIIGWIILWPLILFYWACVGAAFWGRIYYSIYGPANIPDPLPAQAREDHYESRRPRPTQATDDTYQDSRPRNDQPYDDTHQDRRPRDDQPYDDTHQDRRPRDDQPYDDTHQDRRPGSDREPRE